MKSLNFLILVLFLHCGTNIKIPVVEKSPPGFQEFMGGGRNIGIYVYKNESASFGDLGDWKGVIHGGVLNAIQDYRYFKIVDVSSRDARLREVAYSQKMGTLKDISRELSIDGLLFIEVPRSPAHECKSNTFTDEKDVCVSRDGTGKCLRMEKRRELTHVRQLNYTVFANARLVNLETGETKQYSNSAPAVLENKSQSSNIQCPALLQGFNQAVKIASFGIADNLSPRMKDMSVPIYDGPDGLSDKGSKDDVKKLLSSGKKWLSSGTPNLEMAKTNWERALSLSGGQSASAYWNLGVYHWSKGNLADADFNFKKSMDTGGPDWVDSKKREVLSKFQEEKDREKLRERY